MGSQPNMICICVRVGQWKFTLCHFLILCSVPLKSHRVVSFKNYGLHHLAFMQSKLAHYFAAVALQIVYDFLCACDIYIC